jgi:hypothetical protein
MAWTAFLGLAIDGEPLVVAALAGEALPTLAEQELADGWAVAAAAGQVGHHLRVGGPRRLR